MIILGVAEPRFLMFLGPFSFMDDLKCIWPKGAKLMQSQEFPIINNFIA